MKNKRAVVLWLWCGVVMIFVQIVLGGITRLTGSGLSITKWEIVTGTIPPLNAKEWNEAFDLYKHTPQFQKINTGITLDEFKFIYFWEYLHRLWARSIGFVFLFPFIFFAAKGWLTKKLYTDLGIAVLLGALVAAFGWIMVASGLIERPWVSGYKLTIHLNLALLLFSWLLWVAIGDQERIYSQDLKKITNVLTMVIIVQFLLGGLMSGMKAGLYYPTWPDMHGEFFPKILIDKDIWTYDRVIHYERGPIPGIVQFLHRMTAYGILLITAILYWKSKKKPFSNTIIKPVGIMLLLVIAQVVLGIFTVINCLGKIPLVLGVIHQITAILILSNLVYLQRKL